MFPEGKFKAKVSGSFTGQSSEKKTPFIGLEFATQQGNINWIAWVTEKTAKRAVETIRKCGFTGNKMADLSRENAVIDFFNTPKEDIYITVEHEAYTSKEGESKKRPIVRWVNVGEVGPERFSHAKAVAVFNGLSYDGLLVQNRASNNVSKQQSKTLNDQLSGANFTTDDIPF